MPITSFLSELRFSRLDERVSMSTSWGGKAEGLIWLKRSGWRSPATYGLDLSAMGRALRAVPSYSAALAAWKDWNGEGPAPEALALLREQILDAGPPTSWASFCADLFREGEKFSDGVIVRSSMSLEDGERCSLAGAFASEVLPRPDAASLWSQVCNILASAFSESAARRILQEGLNPELLIPSVLLQPHVHAVSAGVCFSRPPMNPWIQKLWIEWTQGPGSTVVEGVGATRTFQEGDDAQAPADVRPFIADLRALATQAETHFAGPVDIEWVWDGQDLWIVQVRAVATPEARLAGRTGPGRRWTREEAQERFPEAMTPLGWTAIEDALQSNFATLDREFGLIVDSSSPMAVRLRGMIYWDPDFFRFPGRLKVRWSRLVRPRTLLSLFELFVRSCARRLTRRPAALVRAFFSVELTNLLIGEQARRHRLNWASHMDFHLARLRDFDERVEILLRSSPTPKGLVDAMDELRGLSLAFLEPDLAVFVIKDSLRKSLSGLWAALGQDEHLFPLLVSRFENNRTLEMSDEWARLLRSFQEDAGTDSFLRALEENDPEASRHLRTETSAAWTSFLERNGHSRTSWDMALPSWKEKPRLLLPLLRSGLRPASRSDSSRGPEPAELRKKFSVLLEARGFACVDRELDVLQDYARMDEDLHFWSGVPIEMSRKLVLSAAGPLVDQRIIDDADDIFFLTLDEMKSALRQLEVGRRPFYRFLARRRKQEWARARRDDAPMDLPPREEAARGTSSEKSRQGVPMSHGRARGVLVRANHFEDLHEIPHGAILLTTSPNPALVPMYPLLGGLITMTGGPMAHGFVAARELGLPAVSGVKDGLSQIPSGVVLTIDGEKGTIEWG